MGVVHPTLEANAHDLVFMVRTLNAKVKEVHLMYCLLLVPNDVLEDVHSIHEPPIFRLEYDLY